MKKLFFIFMMFTCMTGLAQRVDKPGEEYDYYCQVFIDGSYGYIITMDNGSMDLILYKENGSKETFLNDTAILTYMSKRGWTYVNNTQTRVLRGIREGLTPVYLMKKRVKSDKEAMSGLIVGSLNGFKNKDDGPSNNMNEQQNKKRISSGVL